MKNDLNNEIKKVERELKNLKKRQWDQIREKEIEKYKQNVGLYFQKGNNIRYCKILKIKEKDNKFYYEFISLERERLILKEMECFAFEINHEVSDKNMFLEKLDELKSDLLVILGQVEMWRSFEEK